MNSYNEIFVTVRMVVSEDDERVDGKTLPLHEIGANKTTQLQAVLDNHPLTYGSLAKAVGFEFR